MVTRRQILTGFGIVAVSGTVVALNPGIVSRILGEDKWRAKNVVVRNLSSTKHSIHVKIDRKIDDESDCQSKLSIDDICYENILTKSVTLDPDEVNIIEEAYSSPGVYRITAETDTGRSDSNSRIQLWRENRKVTGMGTTVTIRKYGGVSVVGFTNPGVGNPPPLG